MWLIFTVQESMMLVLHHHIPKSTNWNAKDQLIQRWFVFGDIVPESVRFLFLHSISTIFHSIFSLTTNQPTQQIRKNHFQICQTDSQLCSDLSLCGGKRASYTPNPYSSGKPTCMIASKWTHMMRKPHVKSLAAPSFIVFLIRGFSWRLIVVGQIPKRNK